MLAGKAHGAKDTPAAFLEMYNQDLPQPPSTVRGASLAAVHQDETQVQVYPLPPNVWSTSAPLPPVRIVTGVLPAGLRKQRDERNRIATGLPRSKSSLAGLSRTGSMSMFNGGPNSGSAGNIRLTREVTAPLLARFDSLSPNKSSTKGRGEASSSLSAPGGAGPMANVPGMEELSPEERFEFAMLLERVDDINRAVRCDAILAMSQLSFESPLLIQALERHLADYDKNVQFQASLALLQRNPSHEAARDKLLTFLTDAHTPDTRLTAIRELATAQSSSGGFWEQLVRYVAQEKDSQVQFEAAVALASTGKVGHVDPRVTLVLEEKLGEADPDGVFRAGEALLALDTRHDQVANAMLLLLKGSLWSTRVKVVGNLVRMHASLSPPFRKSVAAKLLELLWKDPSAVVKEHVAVGIIEIEEEAAAFAMLKTSLESSDPYVRRAALHCLQVLGVRGEVMARILMDALDDPDVEVRAEAARVSSSLVEKDDYRIGRKLRRCLEDPNYTVRQCATIALQEIGFGDLV